MMKIELPPVKEVDLSVIEGKHQILFDGKYHEPPVLCSIIEGEKIFPIMTLGSFSAWKGQAKGRKSTVLSMVDAAHVMRPLPLFRKFVCPESDKGLLHFDTEQAPHEVYKVVNRVMQLSGNQSHAGGFNMFYLRPFTPFERLEIITKMIEKYSGSIELVVIDGILDLVTEMNSEEQATDLSSWLLRMTEVHNIHIACIIHENYGDGKAAGHVGSYILRKAESIISINKHKAESSLSVVEPSMMRGEHFTPFLMGIDVNGLPCIHVTAIEAEF